MRLRKELLKIIFLIIFVNVKIDAVAITKNKIIASVDNQIVSSYELKNKIKTILFLANQNFNQENVNLLKQNALQQLIDYKLKKNQVTSFEIQLNNNIQINNHLNNLASKYNTNIDGVKKIFRGNGLDFEIYLDEIRTELSWQKLIFDRYKNKIILNEQEIDAELSNYLKSQNDLQEYNLAEIELPFKNNSDDKNTIMEVKNEITRVGFKSAAIKYSISTSASDGGDIGWINAKSLSSEMLSIISKMEVGEISRPIVRTDRIILLQLLDQKKIDINKVDINELRKKIIKNKKNQLLSLYSNNHLSKLKNSALIEIK